MAANKVMPACGHSTAPKFPIDQPHELRRYFQELDILFDSCAVVDDEEKKKHARRYLDIDSSDLWGSLPEHAAMSSYPDFVKAVYKLYPGTNDERKWTVANMDKLIGQKNREGIYNVSGLGEYYQLVYTITEYLRLKNCIS